MRNMAVLAVDPGETTGFCLWSEGAHVHIKCQEKGGYGPTDYDKVRPAIEYIGVIMEYDKWRSFTVVMEEFTITARTTKTKLHRASLIIRDWTLVECHRRGFKYVLQSAAEAKSLSNRRRLQAIDDRLWVPGLNHSQDAARHMDTYLTSTGASKYHRNQLEKWANRG